LRRFGFGPAPGAIAAIVADPRGAVLADLQRPRRAGLVAAPSLPNSAAASRPTCSRAAPAQSRSRIWLHSNKLAGGRGSDDDNEPTRHPTLAGKRSEQC
jgi:hypothetical protein